MTSKHNNVPKFGNWEANAQVPFTLVFEKARADKSSTDNQKKVFNPNDPFDNLSSFGFKAEDLAPSRRSSQQSYAEEVGAVRANSARGRPYTSGGTPRPSVVKLSNSGSRRSANGIEGAGSGEDNGSAEQTPSHTAPAFKGRLGNRPVSSSLSVDKRGSAESGPLHQAPAVRTRFHPSTRGEEMPDKTAALPKFGEWDENDPTSGEAFTIIFSHARDEKKVGGPAHIPALHSDSAAKMNHAAFYKQPQHPIHRKASSWACCFQPPNVM